MKSLRHWIFCLQGFNRSAPVYFPAKLEAADVQLEDEAAIEEALYTSKDSNADFADCLIAAKNRRMGCRATATFNTKEAKLTGFAIAS